jgi:hypothetical protein
LRPKRDDSINPSIRKNLVIMPVFARPFGAAEGWLWLLCRKFCGFWLFSGQGWVAVKPGPRLRRAIAANIDRRLMRASCSACQNRV